MPPISTGQCLARSTGASRQRITNQPITNNQRKTGHSAPTACRYAVSGTISLSSRLCFSPFPHGTCSLSVAKEYLALGGGPPGFRPGSTCPALLGKSVQEGFLTHTGLSPSMGWLSNHFRFVRLYQTCGPATTGPDGSHDTGCATLVGYHAQLV